MSSLAQRLADEIGFEPLDRTFRPIHVADLARLESAYGRLPMDYRWFLQHYGGSRFAELRTVIIGDDEPLVIVLWFGVGTNDSPSDLFWNLERWQRRIPDGLLPVAVDLLGDPILIEAESGSLWLPDFDEGEGELVFVASSFTHLLERALAHPF